MNERIVIVGQGAREHALAHKLAYGASDSVQKARTVMVVGGNAGMAQEFECVRPATDDLQGIVDLCARLEPDLIVIGPESYLADGLSDRLREKRLSTFGPTKRAAALEASKYFAKRLCADAKIITAQYQQFDDFGNAKRFIETMPHDRIVIKVDGLCAGKGVSVCESKAQAILVLQDLYHNEGFRKLGVRDHTVVIEEFLKGSEVSVFGLAHGGHVQLFCPMQDYKRLLDDDQGPNTGGMGSFGPVGDNGESRERFLSNVKETVFLPALHAMQQQGCAFSGLLYAGLMMVDKRPFVLEFNVRFGDPETQALLFGTKVDIFPLLHSIAKGEPVADHDYWQRALLAMDPTIAIVMTTNDYPHKRTRDHMPITLPSSISTNGKIFFAATERDYDGQLCARSGRVLSVVARGPIVADAQVLGYEIVHKIEFPCKHFRHDIGKHITELGL